MRKWQLAALALWAIVSIQAHGAEYTVAQKAKTFSVVELKVKVGDSVIFRNDDPFFHNIFSLAEQQSFDLGTFPQGQSRKVTFVKAGKVEVECAIHPDMKLVIEVTQ